MMKPHSVRWLMVLGLASTVAGCLDATPVPAPNVMGEPAPPEPEAQPDPDAQLEPDAQPAPAEPEAQPEPDAQPTPPEPEAHPEPTAPAPVDVDEGDPNGIDIMPPEPEAPPEPDDEPTEPNALDQDRLFVCDGQPGSSPARIRRIEAQAWSNTIHTGAASRVPLLSRAEHRYSTYSADETMDAPTLAEYLRYSHIPGNGWLDQGNNGNPRIMILRGEHKLAGLRCLQWNWNDRPVQAEPDDACIESYVRGFLEHGVFMRPPTDAEVARLVAFARTQVDREQLDEAFDRRDTIRMISQAAWLMPAAVFRPEVGVPADDDTGRRMLTDDEIAAALSLALTDHQAGVAKGGHNSDGYDFAVRLADIKGAAMEGTISQPEVIADLVRRHLTGTDPAVAEPDVHASDYPRGTADFHDEYWTSPTLRRFFQEWLGYAKVGSVFKDAPAATSRFDGWRVPVHGRFESWLDDAHKGADFAGYLDAFIARIVARDTGVLSALLTSNEYLLPEIVGADIGTDKQAYRGFVYGIDVTQTGVIEGPAADRWHALPADERAGVLTHPAWLGAHGGNFENDPSAIHRGKWIYEELLCGQVPPLPITVDAMLDPDTAHMSARGRLEGQLDANPECARCHIYMNPMGYTFEIYNHAGYVRTDDHGAPPNGAVELPIAPPGDPVIFAGLQVRDAVELTENLSRSPRVKRCFIRQSFRYFMGRDETYADACTLEQMEAAYDGTDGSMTEMLVTLFQSDAFLYRHVSEDAPADEVMP